MVSTPNIAPAINEQKSSFEIAKYPNTIDEFILLSIDNQIAIKEQNQKIAESHIKTIEDQFNSAIDKEAKLILTKLKIKELRYIVDQRIKFSWQERDIAARELYHMGYNVHNHYILEKYNEK